MMTAGIDTPDRRGRTNLDRCGRDLDGNPRVRVREVEVLSCDWYVLRKTTFDYRHSDGHWSRQQRETYDRGDGATILLYDPDRRTVLLTLQFRFPAYANGHQDGMLIEAAAGLLDGDSPREAIRRELAEETGHVVGEAQPVFDVFMSPGSVTERLHFFAAPYGPASALAAGGGIAADGEDITVVELPFVEALAMVRDGGIVDAKTIMLLQWAALEGPFRSAPAHPEALPRPGEPARKPSRPHEEWQVQERRLHHAYVAKINAAVASGQDHLITEPVAAYERECGEPPGRTY